MSMEIVVDFVIKFSIDICIFIEMQDRNGKTQ